MTKQDLRTGMVVETKYGNRYLVLEEKQELISMDSHMEYNTHANDLSYWNDNLTIVKVYKPNVTCLTDMLNNPKNLIWERTEHKELTVSEIEKLLGYPVKIVKE